MNTVQEIRRMADLQTIRYSIASVGMVGAGIALSVFLSNYWPSGPIWASAILDDDDICPA
jgi:hypothetical protein